MLPPHPAPNKRPWRQRTWRNGRAPARSAHDKKSSGQQTVTYEQLLEVALCHGWIDVQTKSVDDERYAIRFSPRRPKSNWTETNRALARRLLAEGRMRPAGLAKLPADL